MSASWASFVIVWCYGSGVNCRPSSSLGATLLPVVVVECYVAVGGNYTCSLYSKSLV